MVGYVYTYKGSDNTVQVAGKYVIGKGENAFVSDVEIPELDMFCGPYGIIEKTMVNMAPEVEQELVEDLVEKVEMEEPTVRVAPKSEFKKEFKRGKR